MGRPASRHRADPVRPRWGRLSALGASLAVTVVALVGGAGLGPDEQLAVAEEVEVVIDPATTAVAAAPPVRRGASLEREPDPAPPADSGTGRRAVFDQSEQRVWLVSGSERVVSTYLVSGSLTDNLQPGTYTVFSRSADAVGIDGSTMRWFVRFTRGPTGAAIGFHDLPVDGGEVVQTLDQLGTPRSHGCIRQRASDAKRMWRFAPLGTTVVVTA